MFEGKKLNDTQEQQMHAGAAVIINTALQGVPEEMKAKAFLHRGVIKIELNGKHYEIAFEEVRQCEDCKGYHGTLGMFANEAELTKAVGLSITDTLRAENEVLTEGGQPYSISSRQIHFALVNVSNVLEAVGVPQVLAEKVVRTVNEKVMDVLHAYDKK
jgi:hypothetical protein